MGPVSGLVGQYYNIQPNNVSNTNPDFVSLTSLNNSLATQAPSLWFGSAAAGPNFDFAQSGSAFPNPYNTNAYNFETIWTGTFNAPTNGTYTFETASDDEGLDLAALARIARLSKFHFLRVFRRAVGATPHQYLTAIRLRRAAARLRETSESVTAIAYDCGFGDLSTFNARFRAAFGQTPSAHRRGEL